MKAFRLATFFSLLFVAFLGISCGNARPVLTKDQVEKKITEDLPVGSNHVDVERYLETQGIEHSWVEEEGVFYAIIRNTYGDFLVKESIQLVIHMDTEKKLRAVEAKSIFTGP